MIELQGAGKRFGGKHRAARVIALHDVTLSIPVGATWGVVGPNGAGKSTLFALLLGFLQPTSGTIRIAGLDPRDYTRRHGAGYMPERFRLPPGWPVRSALQALAALDRVDSPAARVAEVMTQFGLEEHADKTSETLSRGTLQRVGLAQALLARRELVVFDEPTEGLDPLWRLHSRELITQLKTTGRGAERPRGTTILIASHDLNEIERLVDHVVVLADGGIRESFAIAPTADGPRRYRIALEAPLADMSTVFEGIEYTDGERVFTVVVSDAHELSARLAALLTLGAVIESVQPADGLEERVRAAFRGEATA